MGCHDGGRTTWSDTMTQFWAPTRGIGRQPAGELLAKWLLNDVDCRCLPEDAAMWAVVQVPPPTQTRRVGFSSAPRR